MSFQMSVAILRNLYLFVLPLARPIYPCWNSPRRVAAQQLQHKWITWQRLRAQSRAAACSALNGEPLRRRVYEYKNPDIITGRRGTLVAKVKARIVPSPNLNILITFSCTFACDFRSMSLGSIIPSLC